MLWAQNNIKYRKSVCHSPVPKFLTVVRQSFTVKIAETVSRFYFFTKKVTRRFCPSQSRLRTSKLTFSKVWSAPFLKKSLFKSSQQPLFYDKKPVFAANSWYCPRNFDPPKCLRPVKRPLFGQKAHFTPQGSAIFETQQGSVIWLLVPLLTEIKNPVVREPMTSLTGK